MRFLYLLDSFSNGGAQIGLVTLVEYGFFDGHQVSIYGLTGGKDVSERLAASGIPQYVSSILGEKPLTTWNVLSSFFPLLRILWQERPDIMIMSLPRANIMGRLASILFPSLKVVAFEHNTDYKNRFSPVLRYTSGLVDGVFVDHHETWRSLQKAFYPSLTTDRAFYVPLVMFPDVAEINPTKPFPVRKDVYRIISAGRLTEQKNYLELLRAVRKLLDDGWNVELLIAGNGELEDELRQEASLLGLQDRVSFPGFLRDWISLCGEFDIYVQTSLHEGLCLSVLEAMAQGMLVVASDVGGIREYGQDRTNMIKICGGTYMHIADGLAAAMTLDPLAASRIREGAVRTVQDEFGPAPVKRHWRNAMGWLLALGNSERKIHAV